MNPFAQGVEPATVLRVLLEQVADHDSFEISDVVDTIRDQYSYREPLLREMFPHEDPYVAWTGAGIAHLVKKNFLALDDDRWIKGEKFVLREPMKVIGGDAETRVVLTIDPADVRAFKSDMVMSDMNGAQARAQASIHALRENGGPGERRLDPKHIERIKESMELFGYLPEFPILVDSSRGIIIDGRHRQAAADLLGIQIPDRDVKGRKYSDEDILKLTIVANNQMGWSQKDWQRLFVGYRNDDRKRNATRREWIAWEIKDRSDRGERVVLREIAEVVGCSDHTVSDVCAEVGFAQGAQTLPPTKVIKSRVEEELISDPYRTDGEIAETAGAKDVPSVGKNRKRLEESGDIPHVPVPQRSKRDTSFSQEQCNEAADLLAYKRSQGAHMSVFDAAKAVGWTGDRNGGPQVLITENAKRIAVEEALRDRERTVPSVSPPNKNAHEHDWQPITVWRCECGDVKG